MKRTMAAAAGRAVLAATAAAALSLLVGCSEPPTQQTTDVAAEPPPATPQPVADATPAPSPDELGVTPDSPNVLYARIGLAEGAEGVMVLLLDESGGEGGPFVLYADRDLDGKLTGEGEKLAARPNHGDMAMAQFAPFELAGGDEGAPRQMSLYYFGEPGANEHSLRATIIAPQVGEDPEEAMTGMLMGQPELAPTPAEAAVWRAFGEVALEMQTEAQSGRMLCLALTAKLGDAELYAPQAEVDLVIRRPGGEVLTRDHGSLGDFGFG